MKIRRLFLSGAIATTGLTGLVLSIFPRARAMSHRYHSTVAQVSQSRHYVSRFCQKENPGEHIDTIAAVVEQRLNLTAEQTASFGEVTNSLKASSDTFKSLCADLEAEVSAPDQLAQLEIAITTGLEAVQEIREPFNTFYGSLSVEQQTTLNEAISSHRR